MGKLVIGSLVAAVVMFLLGFVFYEVLMNLGWSTAPEATQLAVQEALKALPHSGVYSIPSEGSDALAAAAAAGVGRRHATTNALARRSDRRRHRVLRLRQSGAFRPVVEHADDAGLEPGMLALHDLLGDAIHLRVETAIKVLE